MKYLFLLLSIVVGCSSFENKPVFTTEDGAIRGYDPVSYFNGDPEKGQNDLVYNWRGSDWHFANKANLDKFAKEPEKYSPQYGGYCAYAMRDGRKYEIDPEAFTLKNGKLYLNISKKVNGFWQKDLDENIQKSDSQWLKLNKNN